MKTIYKYESEETRRDNFTQVPNMAICMDLSPFAFKLYVHIRMMVGYKEDGACYKGVRRLAKDCKMSQTSVIKARKELEERGLVVSALHQEGNLITYVTKVKDIWEENSEYCKSSAPNMEQTNI